MQLDEIFKTRVALVGICCAYRCAPRQNSHHPLLRVQKGLGVLNGNLRQAVHQTTRLLNLKFVFKVGVVSQQNHHR